jgi:hypothetical protein
MKRLALWAAAAVASIIAPAALAAPTIGLVSGVPQTFTIPAGAFTTSFFVDVGADATQLKIDLASTGGQDLDLLLRYGSPFPDVVESGLPPSASYLVELSQYYAQSSESSESLAIGQTNVEPVRAGRWYITVLNFGSQTNATLQATTSNAAVGGVPIEVVTNDTSGGCNVAAWSDPTTRAAQTGNNGTTLGQLRVNAIQRAAQLLAAEIKSPVPIRVQACWDNLGTGNSITLAQAGPVYGVRNSAALVSFQGSEFLQHYPFLPRNYTTYSIAPATKLAGTRACGILGGPCNEVYDIRAEFNDQVDTGSALGNRGFWYGFATQLPANDVDFIATAMHEITHGLGFAGAINKDIANGPIGAKFDGHDDIFDANVAWVQGTAAPFTVLPLMAGTDADRAAAMVSNQGLRWTDAAATNSTANPYRQFGAPPENFVRLHAPTTLQPGSTLSHLGNASSENSLMLAQVVAAPRKLGLAAPMMGPLGWSDAVVPPPVRAARPTQYFDPAHVGHGINFGRVSGTFHYLIFYTYGADGSPEYYISTGQLVDGVYTPAPNANGDSLLRIRYNAANSPPQSHDPGINGRVRLDFNGAEFAPACQDGRVRDKSSPLAVMSWTLGNDRNIQWCMQALLPESLRPAQDYTGAYFASAADQGWGFDMLSFPGAGGAQGLGALIYYPDAQGFGRWAYMQEAAFQSGQTYTLYERRGYCRTCPVPASAAAGQFDDVPAGTIAFTLNGTGQAPTLNNRVTFNVELQRPGGGRFQRTNSPLQLISEPVPVP